jgi:ubiquinone/menaquinone biosynthesis C-methylase UbiE
LIETSDHKDRVKYAYDSSAEMYDDTVTRRMISASTVLLRDLKIPENPTVLDVGCGTGISTFEVMKRSEGVGKFYGVDISEKMVKHAKEKAAQKGFTTCKFTKGDAESLEFPDSMFDLVISNVAFHWFPDKLKALKEMYRVLKPGCMVALNFNGKHHYEEATSISLRLAESTSIDPRLRKNMRVRECFNFLADFPTLEEINNLFYDAGFVEANIYALHRIMYLDPKIFMTARDATTGFWQAGLPSDLVESAKKLWLDEAERMRTEKGFKLTFYDIIAYGRKPKTP